MGSQRIGCDLTTKQQNQGLNKQVPTTPQKDLPFLCTEFHNLLGQSFTVLLCFLILCCPRSAGSLRQRIELQAVPWTPVFVPSAWHWPSLPRTQETWVPAGLPSLPWTRSHTGLGKGPRGCTWDAPRDSGPPSTTQTLTSLPPQPGHLCSDIVGVALGGCVWDWMNEQVTRWKPKLREFLPLSFRSASSWVLKGDMQDFPAGPVAKIPPPKSAGQGSTSGQETRSHMPQLKESACQKEEWRSCVTQLRPGQLNRSINLLKNKTKNNVQSWKQLPWFGRDGWGH